MREQRTVSAVAQLTAAALGARDPSRMRAWRLHAYGALPELRLEEARVPALRTPRDVLVRVRAASLNPLDVAMIGEARRLKRPASHSAWAPTLMAGDVGCRRVRRARAQRAARAGRRGGRGVPAGAGARLRGRGGARGPGGAAAARPARVGRGAAAPPGFTC